jgi:hypothetical protein
MTLWDGEVHQTQNDRPGTDRKIVGAQKYFVPLPVAPPINCRNTRCTASIGDGGSVLILPIVSRMVATWFADAGRSVGPGMVRGRLGDGGGSTMCKRLTRLHSIIGLNELRCRQVGRFREVCPSRSQSPRNWFLRADGGRSEAAACA